MFCGTPLWMAPELLEEESFGPKVDVYAYAIIAYQVLTGIVPFGENITQQKLTRRVLDGKRPSLDPVPTPFQPLLKKCWAQNESDRPDFEFIVQTFLNGLCLPKVDLHSYKRYIEKVGYYEYNLSSKLNTLHQNNIKNNDKNSDGQEFWKKGKKLKQNKNFVEAAKYLKKASDLGHPKAMAAYGDLLLNGDGVEMNDKLAVEYFKKSADMNCGMGQNSYACALAHGWGIEKNKKIAAEYFKKSADNGYKWGLFNFALRLKSGIGVKQNLKLSIEYLTKALEKGIDDAQEEINKINESLKDH